MTALAERTLAFIDDFIGKNGYGPTYAEIAAALGFKGHAAVKRHLDRLENEGRIRRLPARARAIEVVKDVAKPAPTPDPSDGPFAALIVAFFPEMKMPSANEAHGLSLQTRLNSRKPPRHPYRYEVPDDLRAPYDLRTVNPAGDA